MLSFVGRNNSGNTLFVNVKLLALLLLFFLRTGVMQHFHFHWWLVFLLWTILQRTSCQIENGVSLKYPFFRLAWS